MPKKSCPIIAVYSPYKNGQDFLAIQYALGGLVPAIAINMKQGQTIHCIGAKEKENRKIDKYTIRNYTKTSKNPNKHYK